MADNKQNRAGANRNKRGRRRTRCADAGCADGGGGMARDERGPLATLPRDLRRHLEVNEGDADVSIVYS